jgi:hypothetical protein
MDQIVKIDDMSYRVLCDGASMGRVEAQMRYADNPRGEIRWFSFDIRDRRLNWYGHRLLRNAVDEVGSLAFARE